MEQYTYSIDPPLGASFTMLDIDKMRYFAPSLLKTDRYSDGSIVVQVNQDEADDLTTYLDTARLSYRMV